MGMNQDELNAVANYLENLAQMVRNGSILSFSDLKWSGREVSGKIQYAASLDKVVIEVRGLDVLGKESDRSDS